MSDEKEFAYDAFISYSHADKDWVRGELLARLEEAGLRVCIDYRDFRPGAPSVKEMRRGVETSSKTLLILTPDYLESAWTEFEQLMLQTLDPANRRHRLIPLLKEKCDLPLEIGYLYYVNFADPDERDISWTQLLTALGAPPLQEAPAAPTRDEWHLAHPYPMPPNFTGRVAERKMLSRWLDADPAHPLLVLCALGGFGKSALAWHWLLHDVRTARWSRAVWWSFYEGDASFDSFLRETLAYLGVGPGSLGPRQQADELLHQLRQPGILLILDGFERALRAYSGMGAAYQGDEAARDEDATRQRDCVSPLAEHFLRSVAVLPGIRSKALMTTRLCPRVLESHGDLLQGCREEELTQMGAADAVAFFRAQGIRGSRTEIERACEPYGYHPLSLRLLAGLIAKDLQQPGDVAAARRLDVSGDLLARRHHVLAQAYENLTPARQELLSRVACFRGAVRYEALCALAETEKTSEVSETSEVLAKFDADLRDLVARGLLHHDRQEGRYDLHPIVRRYAYDRLGAAERTAAHGHLRDYFDAVPPPARVERLEDLAPVIELYHHTVRAGQYDEARTLFRDRIDTPTYYQFGAYQLQIELLRALFPDGEERPPHLKEESAQALTLNDLACVYSLSGQPRRAVPLFEGYAAISEKRDDKANLAVGLGNLACMAQIYIGALRAAEDNLRRRIALCREIEDERSEAVGHAELGRLLAYRGAWGEAEEELAASTRYWEQTNDVQGLCIDEAYRALRALLLARDIKTSKVSETLEVYEAALAAARRALELADETARTQFPYERDYARAHWLLGAAHRVNGDTDEADRHLSEALTRCRSINAVDAEANILLDLARLRVTFPPASGGEAPQAQGGREEALRLAQEALTITERSGYVLQGADVHLFLAEMASEAGDEAGALAHAREARRLATCDGPPDYTYKVAYDEAGALLERLKPTKDG
jgi:tetratricopeptide (TPR) repeat protein